MHFQNGLSASQRSFFDKFVFFFGLFSGIQDVAVKQLDRNGFQGNREFLVEVLMLSMLSNPYLVNLVGYCVDGDQRILVYEYMPNGSLEDHLLGMSKFNFSLASINSMYTELLKDKILLDSFTSCRFASKQKSFGLEY